MPPEVVWIKLVSCKFTYWNIWSPVGSAVCFKPGPGKGLSCFPWVWGLSPCHGCAHVTNAYALRTLLAQDFCSLQGGFWEFMALPHFLFALLGSLHADEDVISQFPVPATCCLHFHYGLSWIPKLYSFFLKLPLAVIFYHSNKKKWTQFLKVKPIKGVFLKLGPEYLWIIFCLF